MKNQKVGTSLGTIVLVIIAITVGAFAWMVIKNREVAEGPQSVAVQPKLVEKSQEQQIQGENKTEETIESSSSYENTSYGYSIYIPADFDFKTAGPKEDEDSLIRIRLKQDGTEFFSVYVEKSKFKNVDEWLNDYQNKLKQINSYEGVEINTPTILSKEKTNIDGVEAKKIVVYNMPYTDYLIVFIKDKFIYKLSYNGLFLSNETNLLGGQQSAIEKKLRSEFQLKYREQLNKIGESFKFTNKMEDVNFCGKTYKTERIILSDVDVIKKIAALSQNNKFRICENIITNTNSTGENLPVKFYKQNPTDADYKDSVYFLNILLQFKIDLKTNNIFILGGFDGEPTFVGKLK
ncbi:MAG TPA: hypothetical protein DEA43_01735 [Candidatus Moranbacteria bacterium]|nr:hypothetical protein [Candidatus Moranbacteria bacterium]HBT45589.1 hypothetical protein [Candidatus Moranbacteria bacterium]